MVSLQDLEEFLIIEKKWKLFLLDRDKENFDCCVSENWLTMLQREKMITDLVRILNRCMHEEILELAA